MPKEFKTRQIRLRIEPSKYEILLEEAEKNNTDLSGLLREIIDSYIDGI